LAGGVDWTFDREETGGGGMFDNFGTDAILGNDGTHWESEVSLVKSGTVVAEELLDEVALVTGS
jgi:hypothetical protein